MQARNERERVAHLLRRFGLGASEAEIEFYGRGGYASAVELLLNFEQIDEAFEVPIELFESPQNNRVPMRGVQSWWMLRLLMTRRPLQEKMTLFWHDHFATSASKVNRPMDMYQQNQLLRTHGLGKFQDLLTAVSQDPAMIFWLDNQFNVRGKPNENFAREVMELFTLGIGHYTERDVQEASRAFTGWSIRRARPVVNPDEAGRLTVFNFARGQFDAGEKEILGNRGPFTGEDVLGILCGHPQTSLHLVTKIWEWFAYPKPERALVERLAKGFRDSGLNVKQLLRTIMMSAEFQSEKARRSVFKCPVDFTVVTLRQLGVGEISRDLLKDVENAYRSPRALLPIGALNQATKSMGMELLFPPDVAGWETGQSWISTATMVERIAWADRVYGTGSSGAGNGRQQRVMLNLPAFGLFEADPSAEGVAQALLSLYDAPLPDAKKAKVVEAVAKVGRRITGQNANQAAAAASRLIFGSPEFQMM